MTPPTGPPKRRRNKKKSIPISAGTLNLTSDATAPVLAAASAAIAVAVEGKNAPSNVPLTEHNLKKVVSAIEDLTAKVATNGGILKDDSSGKELWADMMARHEEEADVSDDSPTQAGYIGTEKPREVAHTPSSESSQTQEPFSFDEDIVPSASIPESPNTVEDIQIELPRDVEDIKTEEEEQAAPVGPENVSAIQGDTEANPTSESPDEVKEIEREQASAVPAEQEGEYVPDNQSDEESKIIPPGFELFSHSAPTIAAQSWSQIVAADATKIQEPAENVPNLEDISTSKITSPPTGEEVSAAEGTPATETEIGMISQLSFDNQVINAFGSPFKADWKASLQRKSQQYRDIYLPTVLGKRKEIEMIYRIYIDKKEEEEFQEVSRRKSQKPGTILRRVPSKLCKVTQLTLHLKPRATSRRNLKAKQTRIDAESGTRPQRKRLQRKRPKRTSRRQWWRTPLRQRWFKRRWS